MTSSQPTQPLTEDDLEVIRANHDRATMAGPSVSAEITRLTKSASDVPRLLDEVDRLRTENAVACESREQLVDLATQRWEEIELLRTQLAAGDASDGYHTHNELYDYRMLYNAHAARGWFDAGYHVVKSWKHADGEKCFGGGWFVVQPTSPPGKSPTTTRRSMTNRRHDTPPCKANLPTDEAMMEAIETIRNRNADDTPEVYAAADVLGAYFYNQPPALPPMEFCEVAPMDGMIPLPSIDPAGYQEWQEAVRAGKPWNPVVPGGDE